MIKQNPKARLHFVWNWELFTLMGMGTAALSLVDPHTIDSFSLTAILAK